MRTITKKTARYGAVLAPLFLLLAACSGVDDVSSLPARQTAPDPVASVDSEAALAPHASIAPGRRDDVRAVVSRVTLNRDAVLGRSFLYGCDLQYSGKNDAEYELTLQSLALGHDVATFHIVGNQLQLVSDQSFLFESDVNKPARLIHAFSIVRDTSSTITIEIKGASPILASVVDGASAGKERTSWVRTVDYVKSSKLLMFESSLEAADGTVYEFMESIFPRDTIVPASYTPLLADADREPLAERFRFLSWGSVYTEVPDEGRVKTRVASRYRTDSGRRVIDWYVTPNVPDAYLLDVKTGIEGWNRYSQAMWGRNMVAFKGKLPADVHIGDPRYNVVNWDNVADAGAAYESQASDPLTGIQSHSLVYLPLAWVNIGKDYWERGSLSEPGSTAVTSLEATLAGRSFLGRKIRPSCIRDAEAQISIQAKEDPETFARALLKAVLFHEVGHALGLGHNFKASLTFDVADERKFSASVMDYNQYNLERGAFEGVASWKGPLLEYDRQAISALYNDAKDIKETDPVLAACDDDEADDVAGGVDPLCIRYDAGADPTARTLEIIDLLTSPSKTLGTVTSLPSALERAASSLPAASTVATLDDAKKALSTHAATLRGLIGFYITSGAGSLRYMATATARLLYVHKGDLLPAPFDEATLRERQFSAVTFAATLESLPPATNTALESAVAAADAWFQLTPAYAGVPAAERTSAVTSALKPVRDVSNAIQGTGETNTLAALRRRVLEALRREPTAPFAFVSTPERIDYEAKALALLERGLTTQVKGKARPVSERTAYIGAILTFKDTTEGERAIARVESVLRGELAIAPDAETREALRGLLKALTGNS